MLDAPSVDIKPVYPKKKLTLISAMFVGFLLGLALAYLAHISDRTYHLTEDLAGDLRLPVLSAIPIMNLTSHEKDSE